MSRATETEHAVQHSNPAAAPGADRAPPDLDEEHDPEPSRRASLAGLRREAAAGGAVQLQGKPPDAKATTPEDQHHEAKEQSREALRAALNLGALRIQECALQVEPITKLKWDEAGVERPLGNLEGLFEEVRGELDRLKDEIRAQTPGYRRMLHGEIVHFAGAVGRFNFMWDRGWLYALGHGQGQRFAELQPPVLQRIADEIYDLAGIPLGNDPIYQWSKQKSSDLQEGVMEKTVEAALACARAVRAAPAGAESQIGDVDRLISHLKEIEALLRRDASAGALGRTFDKQLKNVTREAERARAASSADVSSLAAEKRNAILTNIRKIKELTP